MGGRTDLTLSLEEDYRNNKQLKNGLPDIEWTRNYIFASDKTWFDLYQIDTSNYIPWDEFNQKFNKKINKKKYIEQFKNNITIPMIQDLEELYKGSYNTRRFWKISAPPPRKK